MTGSSAAQSKPQVSSLWMTVDAPSWSGAPVAAPEPSASSEKPSTAAAAETPSTAAESWGGAADLEELAAINFAAIGGSGPYFCVVHVREFSGISRVQKVLGLLDAQKFEVVPLDTFLAMASQNATFKTHFAEDGARRGEGQ